MPGGLSQVACASAMKEKAFAAAGYGRGSFAAPGPVGLAAHCPGCCCVCSRQGAWRL